MKRSKQRDLILTELRNTKAHPSADELFYKVRKTLPKVSLATVYRNLEQLKQHGLIIELPGKVKRYDADLSEHYHLNCDTCGSVRDFEMLGLANEINGLDNFSKQNNIHYRIEFVGTCKNCKDNIKSL